MPRRRFRRDSSCGDTGTIVLKRLATLDDASFNVVLSKVSWGAAGRSIPFRRLRSGVLRDSVKEASLHEMSPTEVNTATSVSSSSNGMGVPSILDIDNSPNDEHAQDLQDEGHNHHPHAKRVVEE